LQLHLSHTTKALVLYPDVIYAYEQLNITKHLPYDKTFSPMAFNDNITCHKSHIEAFKIIEKELSAMRLSGEMKAILGETYIIGTKYLDMK
jgi:hypothetical protein